MEKLNAKVGLAVFYVQQAVDHLLTIDGALKEFDRKSNWNMQGPYSALSSARKVLVDTNEHYKEADAIVKIVNRIRYEEIALDNHRTEAYNEEQAEYERDLN